MDFSMFRLFFLLIPAIIGLSALWMAITAVRDLRRSSRLTSQGQQTQGLVISSHIHYSGSRENRTSRLVETIEFVTDRGQTIRANPTVADHKSVDRQGMTVPVFYDRDRPEQFIAPHNGRSLSPGGAIVKIVIAVVMLVFITFFIVGSQTMMAGFPQFG